MSNDKAKIIAIVGESGSGKSTLADLLEKELGIKNIQSFTTRKERYPGEAGHIFTTKKQYECNKANNTIAGETVFDGELYWTTKGQFSGTCIYVVDIEGVKTLKEKVKDAEIVVIYLKCDENIRYKRMVKTRGAKSLDRIEHDKEAFRIVECNYCIDAQNSIEEVLTDVISIINSV